MISIIDYGVGNCGSIRNMLSHLGLSSVVTADPGEIRRSDHVILPGVGAFDRAMSKLDATGLVPLLNELASGRGVPFLGICLGMQLLTSGSEEGVAPGLGWIPGRAVRLKPTHDGVALPVPNMGWRGVDWAHDFEIAKGRPEESRYYFAHSYHVVCEDPSHAVGTSWYGGPICAAIQRGNVTGMQFHPEKSHKHGMHLLARFARLP